MTPPVVSFGKDCSMALKANLRAMTSPCSLDVVSFHSACLSTVSWTKAMTAAVSDCRSVISFSIVGLRDDGETARGAWSTAMFPSFLIGGRA